MKRVCLGPRPGVRCPWGRLIDRGRRCDDCQRAMYQHRNVTRDQYARKLYGSAAWKRLSVAVVSAATGCFYCGGTSRPLTADHVVAIRLDYGRALDPSNVVASCRSCQERRKHDPEWWGAPQ